MWINWDKFTINFLEFDNVYLLLLIFLFIMNFASFSFFMTFLKACFSTVKHCDFKIKKLLQTSFELTSYILVSCHKTKTVTEYGLTMTNWLTNPKAIEQWVQQCSLHFPFQIIILDTWMFYLFCKIIILFKRIHLTLFYSPMSSKIKSFILIICWSLELQVQSLC